MPGWFASGVLAVAAAASLPSPACALPAPPRPGRAVAATPVLLVCDPDGCRHRFNGFHARPHWNGYWARRAAEVSPVALPVRR